MRNDFKDLAKGFKDLTQAFGCSETLAAPSATRRGSAMHQALAKPLALKTWHNKPVTRV
jgi:hypothetical protein